MIAVGPFLKTELVGCVERGNSEMQQSCTLHSIGMPITCFEAEWFVYIILFRNTVRAFKNNLCSACLFCSSEHHINSLKDVRTYSSALYNGQL